MGFFRAGVLTGLYTPLARHALPAKKLIIRYPHKLSAKFACAILPNLLATDPGFSLGSGGHWVRESS